MSQDNGSPLNTLKPQPGQYGSYQPKFHPLPGPYAKEQLEGKGSSKQYDHSEKTRFQPPTELQRALAAERAQHEYWEEWQGVKPGKPIYQDPRAFQNTLLPVSKYGTDGRGD